MQAMQLQQNTNKPTQQALPGSDKTGQAT